MKETTDLPNRIAALSAAGFTEEELAVKLDISFEDVRRIKFQAKVRLETPPCLAALLEMRTLYEGDPMKDLARRYYTDLTQVRKALYTKLKSRRPSYDHSEILEYVKEHGVDAATEHFGCHYLLPRFIARKAGIMPPSKRKTPTVTDNQKHMANSLAKSRKYTQTQIGQTLGLSQATVSRLVGGQTKSGYVRHDTDKKKEIVAYAEKHSVTDAHRKYGVSRAAVYKWMKELSNGR